MGSGICIYTYIHYITSYTILKIHYTRLHNIYIHTRCKVHTPMNLYIYIHIHIYTLTFIYLHALCLYGTRPNHQNFSISVVRKKTHQSRGTMFVDYTYICINMYIHIIYICMYKYVYTYIYMYTVYIYIYGSPNGTKLSGENDRNSAVKHRSVHTVSICVLEP